MKLAGLYTSESVSEGHPDKIADQVSDAILDAIMKQDTQCRVACEVLVKMGMILVAGEISTSAWVDIEQIARNTINKIGYNSPELGFDAHTCAVLTAISKQSPDIAQGVDGHTDHQLGAGDQGMMVGYACNETEVLMPAPITYAHRLMRHQAELRHNQRLTWLRPDAKAQVTLRYDDGKPTSVDSIVVSTQHAPEINADNLHEAICEEIIKPVLPAEWITKQTHFHINPTGRFVVGGPVADCGLTGRKIIVDTYGSMAPHGGGCFSGKDPSKVDRSGAYAARYVAKNIVAAGLAERCLVRISYAIGVAEPTSIQVETFGTSKISADKLTQLVRQHFDLRPRAIIEQLDLLRPIYSQTATYGHFGRNGLEFSWERTNKVDALSGS